MSLSYAPVKEKKVKTNNGHYTQGSIAPMIGKMAFHMSFGFLAMSVFNLTDTFFVSRLGTTALAAMGFTQPLVFMFFSILFGLGIATSAVISRVVGSGDHLRMKRLTTDALLLALLMSTVLAVIGLSIISGLLSKMGAEGQAYALAKEYMLIWLCGFPFAVLPMVGNNSIRACGNTAIPAIIMSTSAMLNLALDPLFIFGFGPFPALGVKGAAIATVISRTISMVSALCIIGFKMKLLSFSWPGFREIFRSWGALLHTAAPASATHICMPFSISVVTFFAAQYGQEVVAAMGAAMRFEQLTTVPIMALSMVLLPFIGQNFGGGQFGRIFKAMSLIRRFMLGWGVLIFAIIFFARGPISRIFSTDPLVLKNIEMCILIMTTSHAMIGFGMSAGNGLNAIGSPLKAAFVTFMRTMIFTIPMSWLGGHLFGAKGLFIGMALSRILAGIVAERWLMHTIKLKQERVMHAEAVSEVMELVTEG